MLIFVSSCWWYNDIPLLGGGNSNNGWKTMFVTASSASGKNLYKLLGVSPTCSPKELQKAYRKAALRAHPDKEGGNEERFKEISTAYEILSDPQQRARYDKFGHAGISGTATAGGGPSSSSSFFGSQPQSQRHSYTSSSSSSSVPPEFSQFFQEYYSNNGNQNAPGGGNRHGMFGFSFGGGNNNNGGGATSFGLDDWIRQMMMGGGGGGGTQTRTRGTSTRASSYPQSRPRPRPPPPPPTLKEVTRPLTCTLADLYLGKTKTVTLQINNNNNKNNGAQAPLQQQYTIRLKPGWKAGTKIKFKQRGRHVPPITFVIEEAKHATLERRGDDLVYRHKVVPLPNSSNASQQQTNSKKKKKKKGKTNNDKKETSWSKTMVTNSVRLSITLPDGHVWERMVPAERVERLLKPGQSLTVPDMGMPIKDTNERGNLIIEFY